MQVINTVKAAISASQCMLRGAAVEPCYSSGVLWMRSFMWLCRCFKPGMLIGCCLNWLLNPHPHPPTTPTRWWWRITTNYKTHCCISCMEPPIKVSCTWDDDYHLLLISCCHKCDLKSLQTLTLIKHVKSGADQTMYTWDIQQFPVSLPKISIQHGTNVTSFDENSVFKL